MALALGSRSMMTRVAVGRIATAFHEAPPDAWPQNVRSRCACSSAAIAAPTARRPGLMERPKARWPENQLSGWLILGTTFGLHLLVDEQDWFHGAREADRGGAFFDQPFLVRRSKGPPRRRGLGRQGRCINAVPRSFVGAVPQYPPPGEPAPRIFQGPSSPAADKRPKRQPTTAPPSCESLALREKAAPLLGYPTFAALSALEIPGSAAGGCAGS